MNSTSEKQGCAQSLSLSFEQYLRTHISPRLKSSEIGAEALFASQDYSLFSGGKRFRPMLVLMTGSALGADVSHLLPYAAAVEMVHTYSLIHDDLPAMDNDYVRRGRPTTHVLYGEATALLAGDSLLTESFHLIADAYLSTPGLAVKLIKILSQFSGVNGMVGGQALDLSPTAAKSTVTSLLTIHRLKTAALITASVLGAGNIAYLPEDKMQILKQFANLLGISFQITDDLHDFEQNPSEKTNIAGLLGPTETKAMLLKLSDEAKSHLVTLGLEKSALNDLVTFNIERMK